MADLDEDQWDLGGVVFGRGQPVAVEDFDPGDVGARLGDVDVAGGEGVVPGYDYHGGRTLSLTVFTDQVDAASAQTAWRSLEALWRQRDLRYTPRAVVPLRIRLADRPTVRVYGRPRRFTPTSLRSLADGSVGAVATFDAMHTNYYSDTEHTTTLTLVPDLSGGVTVPYTVPFQLSAVDTSADDTITNGGGADAWPIITFTGPITQPEIRWVGTAVSMRLATTIASGQTVTLDPRPWARSITRSDGASLAGLARGSHLEDLALPPGPTTIAFRGQDATGTATCQVSWRDAHTTP